RTLSVHAQGQLLDVQNDVDDILANAFQRRELVNNAVDLNGRDRRALKRRQQNATKRVAERHTETALERFGDQTRLMLRVRPALDLRFLGTDQLLPVSFDHKVPRTGFDGSVSSRSEQQEPPGEGVGGVNLRRDGASADGSRCAASASRRGSS